MTKTYTLTQEELDQLIAERMAHKPITPQGLFREVQFDGDELLPINLKYPSVSERLRANWNPKLPDPARLIYTNVPKVNDVMNQTNWSKICMMDVHTSVRSLVLRVFGKSNNSDLTEDEYEMAQALYSELKEWYIKAYDKRLETLEV